MYKLPALMLTATVALAIGGPACAAAAADSPLEVRPLLVGTEIPDLTLTAADGKSFELRAANTEQRAIVIFYRGGW
jgi:cytochrome oxidase Cu insertion factor (SCO1/SenC/PrrC family)